MAAHLHNTRFFPPLRAALLAVAALGALGACSMETPAHAPLKRVQLQQSNAHKSYPVSALNDEIIRAVAHDYTRAGEGPLEIIISYDPRARTNNAMNASTHAANIANNLRAHAVTNLRTAILPVNALGEEARVMFEYKAVTAHAPDGCVAMGGLDGATTGTYEDYEYGCSVEMFLARQIARPRDLAGRGDLAPADGRRQALTTENYRSGQNAPALSGYTID